MSAITDILKADEEYVALTTKILNDYGIWNMYDRLEDLFKSLHDKVNEKLGNDKDFPFACRSNSSIYVVAWDQILRLSLALSAQQQFYVAASHLLRGQISEVFGHARRAIEAGGIAYLSRSEPDIATLFIEQDRQTFRNRTTTGKILPNNDPLTVPLRTSIDWASKLVHNNFISFAHRLKQDWSEKDGAVNYKYSFLLHDLNKDSQGYFINISLWILRAGERVAALLAASFSLCDSEWDAKHASFKQDLDHLYQKLERVILQNV
jgi:hypothetical protein